MSRKHELIKNTLILGLGKVSTQLISLFLLPIYTIFLAPDEFGAFDLILTYISLLVPAITLQLEMASFRFLIDARNNEAEKKRVISNVLRIVLSIVAICTTVFLIVNAFLTIHYAYLILLNVVIAIFSSMFLQFARGLGNNKAFAIACTLAGVTTLVSNILLIVFVHMGAEGMLLSLALSNIICSTFLFFSLKIHTYLDFNNNDKLLQKQLIKYSFPLVPNGISWWAISLFDRTIIAMFLGVAANGIYAVSSKYATIFTSIFSIFGMSWTESASVHINSKERDSFFTEVFRMSVRAFGALGLVLIAALPLVFGIIDRQYAEAYLYVPLLIIGAFFNAIVGLYSAIYVARKMTKQVMTTSLFAAAINIALNFVLITFIGLYAAAFATAAAYLAMAVYRHFDIKSYIHIHYERRILLILGMLYGLVIYLYYLNVPFANYANVMLAAGSALYLNADVGRALSRRLKRKR